jgi:transcriptional regulator GlxA family with amidase domain
LEGTIIKFKKMKKILFLSFIIATLIGCQNKNIENKAAENNNAAPKTHEEMMSAFPAPKHNIQNVGILLYDGFTTLDAMGPFQVLSEMMGVNVFFVAPKKGVVKNMNGVGIVVERDFSDTDSLDILVIPGGFKETYTLQKDTALLNWVKKVDKTTTFTTSVCTGAWLLGATGLLKGKNATTHWFGKDILKTYNVNVKDERYVRDGKYWTSAGVTAGMDMCLAIVNEIRGEAYTKIAMLDLEYDPKPPFKAGSEQNTEKDLVEMMRAMYENGLKPLKEAEKR